MAIGYTMIEMAQMRKKNRETVAIKNFLIFSISLIVFFVIGYAFAFGPTSVNVIGAQYEYLGVYSASGLYHER